MVGRHLVVRRHLRAGRAGSTGTATPTARRSPSRRPSAPRSAVPGSRRRRRTTAPSLAGWGWRALARVLDNLAIGFVSALVAAPWTVSAFSDALREPIDPARPFAFMTDPQVLQAVGTLGIAQPAGLAGVRDVVPALEGRDAGQAGGRPAGAHLGTGAAAHAVHGDPALVRPRRAVGDPERGHVLPDPRSALAAARRPPAGPARQGSPAPAWSVPGRAAPRRVRVARRPGLDAEPRHRYAIYRMPVPANVAAPARGLLRDEAFRTLRSAIVDGTLAPGERLVDAEPVRLAGGEPHPGARGDRQAGADRAGAHPAGQARRS
nr:hypothetical protein [Angustibacter aerolatus]